MSRLEIIESEADFKRALKEIEKSGEWVSYDTETPSLNPFQDKPYLVSLGIGTVTRDWTFPLNHYRSKLYRNTKEQNNRLQKLNEIIAPKKKAAHNGKFDSLWLKQVGDFWWFCDFDTMLAHYNLNENERHGLKELSVKYLGAKDYDIPLSWKNGIEGPLDKHCEYLGYDVEYVLRLKRIFLRMLQEEPATHKLFNHLTMPLSRLYTKVEHRGVPIDETKLQLAHEYWEKIAVSSDKELRRLTKGYTPKPNKKGKVPELNFGSPQQLSELLFGHLQLKPLDKTPGGAFSTSESVLKRLDHPICQHILDNREANKNLGTYVASWRSRLDKNGRIHPTFKVHGTVTGRPACEEPNLQATPRDPRIRAIIDAPLGWVLLEVDYSQAELRIVADISQDPQLLKIYKEGGDVHTSTAQEIFGLKQPTEEQRKKTKAVNFGFVYGMWWKNFIIYARDKFNQKFSDKEAQNAREGFFRLYAALPYWHKKQEKLARMYGYVTNKIGRKRRLPDAQINTHGQYNYKVSEALRQAINSPVQSLASDINLLSAIEIDNTVDNRHCQMIGSIHDANLFLVRKDKLDIVAPQIRKIMENPTALREVFKCKLTVPLVCDMKVGPWSQGVKYDFKKKEAA